MRLSDLRRFALGLPEVGEAPHHHYSSWRVRGKIFATLPPEGEHVHLFVDESTRERALAMHPQFVDKLFWGGKVAGLRVSLAAADAEGVRSLLHSAWRHKAPRALPAEGAAPPAGRRPKRSA